MLKKMMFKRLFSTNLNLNVAPPHVPVMLNEVLDYLKPKNNETILDMTFGAGGHTRRILNEAQNLKMLCLDRDPVAFSYANRLKDSFEGRHEIVPLLGRFSDLPLLLKNAGIGRNSIDSVLFDFGCSSMQFEDGSRGFSLVKNGPLDMRMDGDRNPEAPTAADVLAKATEEDIYKIIKYYGEEKNARKIARAIIDARYSFKPLTTTFELAELVSSCCIENYRTDKLKRPAHVATKTFQALRIFVNNELNEINYGIILSNYYLKIGGRLITVTFHSLEDKIVKRHLMGNVVGNMANELPLKYCNYNSKLDEDFMKDVADPKWRMLHKHVVVPRFEEVEDNPRCRSAKLRAAVKLKDL